MVVKILIQALISIGLILAIFVVLYVIWGIMVAMFYKKYFVFLNLKKKEVEHNKKLSEIEVRIFHSKEEQKSEEEKRNQLLLANYELSKEKIQLISEVNELKQLIDSEEPEEEETPTEEPEEEIAEVVEPKKKKKAPKRK